MKEWNRVQASEMKFIKAIKSKTRWDRIRNKELTNEIFEDNIREKVQKKGLKWFGQLKRIKVNRIPRAMEKLPIRGKKPNE